MIAGALVATSSFAQNTEDTSKETHKEFTNPITKTKHMKDKSKKKVAGPHGTEEVDVVKKTTVKKSGETKEHVEIEGDSTKKPE
jgi:exopolysaccharide biosynthesis protein